MFEKMLGGHKLRSIGRKLLSERVYETLKEEIVSGNLPPETKLAETEVATQMEVSATPVREAFRRLAAEGFVRSIPWRGVVVSAHAAKEVKETFQCREVLEGLAIRLAAENIDDAGLRRLKQLLQQADETEDTSQVCSINQEFHALIIDYAQNEKLKEVLGAFSTILLRHRLQTINTASTRRQVQEEHQAIVEALETRDVVQAEQAMRTHLQNGLTRSRLH